MLTKFQYNYLRSLIDKGINGKNIDRIIFAITSADHANTRRNPIPLYLRVLAIEKFSRDLPFYNFKFSAIYIFEFFNIIYCN